MYLIFSAAPPYLSSSSQMYPPPPPPGSSSHMDRHIYSYPSSGYTYPGPSASGAPAASYPLGSQYRDAEYSSQSTSLRGGAQSQQSSSVTSYSPHPASFPSEPDAQYAHNMLNDLGITPDQSEWPLSLGYQGPGPESTSLPTLGGYQYREAPRAHAYPPTSYQYPMPGLASFSQPPPPFGSGR